MNPCSSAASRPAGDLLASRAAAPSAAAAAPTACSRLPAALFAAALLGGCATLSPDAGFDGVAAATQQRTGQTLTWARSEADLVTIEARVGELLAQQPLGADRAVQVALLNNRGLQARFQDLGITEAEVVQATRLPNPGFSFGRARKGDEREIERSLHLNLARLVAWPLVSRLEARRLEQVRGEVALAVLALAADTRRAWVQAVAADETVRYMHQVRQAAEAGAELARRMEQAGNFNKLARAREQGFYAEAALGLARAEQAQRAARERLVRLMGLWGARTAFTLPERLPDLPAAAREQPDIEQLAMGQRLDVMAAKASVEQTARQLGLTRRTRFINVLELGLMHHTSNEAPRQTGWEVSVELPLFDWGTARVARAEALYMQALHRAAQTAVDARSEVREAYGHYRFAFDIARHHRDEIVPLRKRISEEQLLRYNGMLIGVFELLADARAQIASVSAAIEALRDFWLAEGELEMALIGKAAFAPSTAAATRPAAGAAAMDTGADAH
ncbi:MAG: TolC family protein [Rubrivivax sp.]|nr:TolC family protein [Rubrivivax sp.]